VVLVNVTGAIRRPASTTVGPKSTGDANALDSNVSGTKGAKVDDGGRNGDEVEGTTTRGNVVSGNLVTTTDGASVVAGTVDTPAVVVLGTADEPGAVEVTGGVVVGGAVVVGTVVEVEVVVVVVSTTPPSDDFRSTAHTEVEAAAGAGPNEPSSGAAAVANTSHRPYCEIETRPLGAAAASASIGGSGGVTPEEITRMAPPRT
jgi:hypothetical protein